MLIVVCGFRNTSCRNCSRRVDSGNEPAKAFASKTGDGLDDTAQFTGQGHTRGSPEAKRLGSFALTVATGQPGGALGIGHWALGTRLFRHASRDALNNGTLSEKKDSQTWDHRQKGRSGRDLDT